MFTYSRTFTILITEDYDLDGNPTDKEAVKEMRDSLQDCFDKGLMVGANFLVTEVEQGDKRFWDAWGDAIAADRNAA